jgi:hypothetical protein
MTRRRHRYFAVEMARHKEATRLIGAHLAEVTAGMHALDLKLAELHCRGRPDRPRPQPSKTSATTAWHGQV